MSDEGKTGRMAGVMGAVVMGVVAVGAFMAVAPSKAAERDDGAEALMAADRAFAAAAAERGLDGWMSYFADDAARVDLHTQVIRGIEGIREHDAAVFANPEIRLTWDPIDAGLFDGGKLGYTRGGFEVVRTGEDGTRTMLSSGHYLSLWRLDDGEWKVILDTGAPLPPKPPEAPAEKPDEPSTP